MVIKEGKEIGSDRSDAIFNRFVKKAFSEKVIFEQRPE